MLLDQLGQVVKKKEAEELVESVKNSLIIANSKGWNSVSMPAISSGIFGFPKPLCAELMFKTVMEFYEKNPRSKVRLIRFTNFDALTVSIFQAEYEKLFPGKLAEELKVKPPPEKKKEKKKRSSEEEEEEEEEDDDEEEEEKEKEKKLKKNKAKEVVEEVKGEKKGEKGKKEPKTMEKVKKKG